MDSPNQKVQDMVWTSDSVSQFWDALRYTSLENSSFSRTAGARFIETITRYISSDDEILDWGCGNGILVSKLAESGFITTGYDIAPRVDVELNKQLSKLPNYRGILADLGQGAQYDVLIVSEVYEHILAPELEEITKEWTDLVKPGGKIIFTTPHQENLSSSNCLCPNCFTFFHRWQHQRSVSVKELQTRFESRGFTSIHAGAYDFSSSQELLSTGYRYQRGKDKLESSIRAVLKARESSDSDVLCESIMDSIDHHLSELELVDEGLDYREGAGQVLIYVAQKIT